MPELSNYWDIAGFRISRKFSISSEISMDVVLALVLSDQSIGRAEGMTIMAPPPGFRRHIHIDSRKASNMALSLTENSFDVRWCKACLAF